MKSLSDVQNTAFMAVGPSRIAALSLLALAQDPKGTDAGSATDVLTLSVQRIAAAHAMLSSGLDSLLQECSYSLPKDLEAKRQACLDVLGPLHSATSRPEGGPLENVRRIPDLAGLCLYRLEPAVSGFLSQMVQTLCDAQKMREEEREQNMRTTIANAEGVGRNIKFISFNASIEAARIGDMGKGFAVIATEIRELSGKTQTLLEEISGYLRH
ncbi:MULTISPECIES: methyl-accepting chemotaxis protein [unclassified Leisingera]|uniref:methyl-accepting chemotaxis protein n=1 Tax=unclassified Leisingera TaxID=2614906 RepID=UPI00101398C1|nr:MULTISPECIES: methyl-accepting chemotaxis protein [unclassified Leisingera]MBQ4823668.1 methyl-accepting chemotaxis protein [Leisingera sp. HS039]QAX30090.1 methyl-accepting chemotaxis protein [Leisingera sp. NJS204]QBR35966.1 methyl-accepting chemotaxis protein [Leisingera sp. NJS201]